MLVLEFELVESEDLEEVLKLPLEEQLDEIPLEEPSESESIFFWGCAWACAGLSGLREIPGILIGSERGVVRDTGTNLGVYFLKTCLLLLGSILVVKSI